MTFNAKLRAFSSLVGEDPGEAFDRLRTYLELRSDPWLSSRGRYEVSTLGSVIKRLQTVLESDLLALMREPALKEIERTLEVGREASSQDPIKREHDGDRTLGRLCYLLCRSLRPENVLETGVAHGVTTSYILQALDVNRYGRLLSIDLPPLGDQAGDCVGRLVPERLKSRWELARGSAARLLPQVLGQLHSVDLFVHDSLHTFRHMRREFDLVGERLSSTSAVIADDIEGNRAFDRTVRKLAPRFSAAVGREEKDGLIGVLLP